MKTQKQYKITENCQSLPLYGDKNIDIKFSGYDQCRIYMQARQAETKMCIIFNTVIGLSHLFCHSVIYFLSNHSVIFLTHLHSISEHCRILNTIPSSSSREGGKLREASQMDQPSPFLYLNPALGMTRFQNSLHQVMLKIKSLESQIM